MFWLGWLAMELNICLSLAPVLRKQTYTTIPGQSSCLEQGFVSRAYPISCLPIFPPLCISLFWTSVKILKPVAMNQAFSLSPETAPTYLPLPCLMQLPSRLPLLSPSAFLASDSEGKVLPLFSSFHQQPLRALACLACYVNLSSQIPIKLSSCPPESVLKGTPCSLVTSPIASLTPSAPLPSSPSLLSQ